MLRHDLCSPLPGAVREHVTERTAYDLRHEVDVYLATMYHVLLLSQQSKRVQVLGSTHNGSL